jgi:hypothetical protein
MPLVTRLPTRLKRTCVGSNGILECTILPKNAHRTAQPLLPHALPAALGLYKRDDEGKGNGKG